LAAVIDRVEDLVKANIEATTKAAEQLGSNTEVLRDARSVLEEVRGLLTDVRDEKQRANDRWAAICEPIILAFSGGIRPIFAAIASGITLLFTLFAGYYAGKWGLAPPSVTTYSITAPATPSEITP
jgi:hypothetical protein